MTLAWLSFVAAFVGLGLISLTIPRHAPVASGISGHLTKRRSKVALRLSGIALLSGSCMAALCGNLQLGALYWSGHVMIATLLVTGIHAVFER